MAEGVAIGGGRAAREPAPVLVMLRRWWGARRWGLRAQLLLLICGTLSGLYVIGLYLSAQELQHNFEREYIERANLLALAVDATLVSKDELFNDPRMQQRLDRLKASGSDILMAQLYVAKPQGLVVTASTDQGAVGSLGDSNDTAPLRTDRVQVTERGGSVQRIMELNAPLHVSGEPAGVLGIYIDLSGREDLVRAHLFKFAGLGALALLILGALLYAHLRRAVIGPIDRLVDAAAALSRGRFEARVASDGMRSEIGQLVDSFNRMADSLAAMNAEQRVMAERMRNLYFDSIQALAAALDARDHYTVGHSNNVARFATLMASQLGLSAADVESFRFAGLLHDIGKIGVPDKLLRQRGPLDADGLSTIRAHPALGAAILQQAEHLADLAPLVRHHHERYDGRGYPDGLRGEEIPLGARVLSVADAFDAMTSNRPYRRALEREAAIGELVALRGQQFDPAVVDAFLTVLDRLDETVVATPQAVLSKATPAQV